MSNPILKCLLIFSILWIDFVTLGEIFTFPRSIDPKLEHYLEEFRADAAKRGVTVRPWEVGRLEYLILFGDENSEAPTIGQTFRSERFGYQVHLPLTCQIYIKTGLDPEYSERATVYHELGHCLLGLDHDPDQNQIMFWRVPAKAVLMNDWEGKLDHLFATPRK